MERRWVVVVADHDGVPLLLGTMKTREKSGRRRPRQRRPQSPRLLQCRRRPLAAMWLSRGPPTARVPKHSRVATVASAVRANSSPSAAAPSTLETTKARVLLPRRGAGSQHTVSKYCYRHADMRQVLARYCLHLSDSETSSPARRLDPGPSLFLPHTTPGQPFGLLYEICMLPVQLQTKSSNF